MIAQSLGKWPVRPKHEVWLGTKTARFLQNHVSPFPPETQRAFESGAPSQHTRARALTCKEGDDQADPNDGCFLAVSLDDRSGQPVYSGWKHGRQLGKYVLGERRATSVWWRLRERVQVRQRGSRLAGGVQYCEISKSRRGYSKAFMILRGLRRESGTLLVPGCPRGPASANSRYLPLR